MLTDIATWKIILLFVIVVSNKIILKMRTSIIFLFILNCSFIYSYQTFGQPLIGRQLAQNKVMAVLEFKMLSMQQSSEGIRRDILKINAKTLLKNTDLFIVDPRKVKDLSDLRNLQAGSYEQYLEKAISVGRACDAYAVIVGNWEQRDNEVFASISFYRVTDSNLLCKTEFKSLVNSFQRNLEKSLMKCVNTIFYQKIGIYFGVELLYNNLLGEAYGDSLGKGFGLDFKIGYSFNEKTSLAFGFEVSVHSVVSHDSIINDYRGYGGFYIDGIINLLTIRRVQPYLSVGIGIFTLVDDKNGAYGGFGGTIGVGIEYSISHSLSLNSEIGYKKTSFSTSFVNENFPELVGSINGDTFSITIIGLKKQL